MGRNFKAESNSFFAELSLLFNQEIKIKEVPRVNASCIHNSLLRWRGQVWAHLVATIQDPRKVTLSTMTLKEKLNAMHRLWSRETTVLNPDSVVIGLGHKTSQWNVESLCPDLGEVDHSRPCIYPETQETLLCHLAMPAQRGTQFMVNTTRWPLSLRERGRPLFHNLDLRYFVEKGQDVYLSVK